MTHLYQPEGTALNDNQMTRLRDAFARQRVSSEALVARLREERERQADFIVDTRTVRMVPVNEELRETLPDIPQSERLQPVKPKVAIVPRGEAKDEWFQEVGPVAANAHAHAQIASHLEIPKKYYLKMLEEEPDLLSNNVNTWFDANPKKRMFRTMTTNGDPGAPRMAFARGFLSDSYRRGIDSLELTDAILPVLEDPAEGWELNQCGITDLAMHIEASYPNMTEFVAVGDPVALAVKIRTSDVGAGAISVGLGFRRLVCSNIMLVPEYTERIIHRTGKQGELVEILSERTLRMEDELVMAKLGDLISGMVNSERFLAVIRKMRDADGTDLADPVAASELLGKNLGLGVGELHAVQGQLMSSELKPNMWGLANALTATARELEFERKSELEAAAGKLIHHPSAWTQYAEAVAA